MADDDAVELAEEAKPKPSKRKWLIYGIAGLVLLGGGTGGALYFLGGTARGAADQNATAEEEGPQKPEAIYVAIDPPFTVNFQGNSRARFLQITLEAMTRDPKMQELLEKHMPVIRNDLVMLFSSKTASELKTREGKEQLQAETLADIRKIIEAEARGEAAAVEAVYFTSFVMQ